MEEHITNYDMNLVAEFFAGMDRQGPGCDEQSLLALGFAGQLSKGSRVADMGAGTGSSALVLAEYTPAFITAVDFLPLMIGVLRERAGKAGYSQRIEGVVGAMDEVAFPDGSLDMVWSEGAVSNIGFERGLRLWHRFLKPGGAVAVSDLTWLTHERPEEIQRYFTECDPEIALMEDKVAAMERAGYRMKAAFVLPEDCWTDNYYTPVARRLDTFMPEHAGEPAAEKLAEGLRHEIEMYEEYGRYYGYVFYIGEKL